MLDLGLSQDGLAQLIGASRNAVVTALTRLRDHGLIATAPRRFELLSLPRLAKIAYIGLPDR
ncbi:helix-turn-helix domain-containing protein [Micromonospora sp. LOL_023]|uniref:helix-turn-helix domain-containing protein n=1 Tax=Micromonospora sp. LOL_023 TaxID=3345418 RepID=UPI003A868FE8